MNSDFLLVRELDETPDPSGLVRPYGRRSDEPVQAEVLLAGEGVLLPQAPADPTHSDRAPMLAKVGDIVLLQFNAGTAVRIDGEVLRIVPDRDLFAVVERA